MRKIQLSALIALVISLMFAYQQVMAGETSSFTKLTITNAQADERDFLITIARTPLEQARGLMFRKSMPANQGMLFISESPEIMTMWMKNTYIPLDMVFIGEDEKIVDIHRSAEPLSEEHITPKAPAIAVLEVNGGLTKTLDINIGDKVSYAQ